MARVYNFSAGPSMLPEKVLRQAQAHDAAAFADAVRQPDAVIPQCAVIDRNVSFCHGRLLSLSCIDNRILSIILRQSSGFNSDS